MAITVAVVEKNSRASARIREIVPGLVLCLVVTTGACFAERAQEILLGKAWLEALVLAIIGGTITRSCWTPGARWEAGIEFSARYLLEIAVVLLGVSVSATTIVHAGPMLLAGIALVVAVTILIGYAAGRLLGLPVRMALLVACGNAICGNSAIAAIAPVIDADPDDVAAAIAFTAVLGVGVVLGLPLLCALLGMNAIASGAFAGLTVYAVPQVIAATTPMGAAAVQIGTLVKLVRVLMLGPVCIVLALVMRRPASDAVEGAGTAMPFGRLVPWFIIGFLAIVMCRSFGLVPPWMVAPMSNVATMLTVVSMAALGLGVDVRSVTRAGAPVTAAVLLSLAALGGIAFALVGVLHLR